MPGLSWDSEITKVIRTVVYYVAVKTLHVLASLSVYNLTKLKRS